MFAGKWLSLPMLAAALSAHRSAAFDVHVLAGSGCGAAEVAASGIPAARIAKERSQNPATDDQLIKPPTAEPPTT
jgi:hypothetical protein